MKRYFTPTSLMLSKVTPREAKHGRELFKLDLPGSKLRMPAIGSPRFDLWFLVIGSGESDRAGTGVNRGPHAWGLEPGACVLCSVSVAVRWHKRGSGPKRCRALCSSWSPPTSPSAQLKAAIAQAPRYKRIGTAKVIDGDY